MMPLLPVGPPTLGQTAPKPPDEDRLRAVAQKLEASFLSEMLKAAGFGKPPETFGGGTGEEQFSSFLRDEQARMFAQKGGIGLAESIFKALSRQQMKGDT